MQVKLAPFYNDCVNTIQEQECAYIVMMKHLGFGAFVHAISSLATIFFLAKLLNKLVILEVFNH
jgi:hypothetical protein